jgi:cytochrome c oxidase assembly protein subunit 15
MPVSKGLHWFALITAFATLGLVGVGGLVTSHGVGMAVPDWPNTYGYNMFFFPFSQWVGGVLYEHSHRLVASGVGLMTTILALWLYGTKSRPVMRWGGLSLVLLGLLTGGLHRWSDAAVLGVAGVAAFAASFLWPRSQPAPAWLRRLGLLAFIAVIVQGVLGGLRVTQMKDELGIFHGTLAQLFFVLLCAIALFTSWRFSRIRAELQSSAGPFRQRIAWLLGLATTLILGQLVLGATMRHQHAGLAIPDFPLAYNKLWPDTDPASVERYNQRRLEITALDPITRAQVLLQMAHRIVAGAIFFTVAACAWSFWRTLGLRNVASRLALLWFGLVFTQVLLGAATIWSEKAADIATAHVTVGALSLAAGAILCIVTVRTPAGVREPHVARRGLPAGSAARYSAV